jgi:hypothetical protein
MKFEHYRRVPAFDHAGQWVAPASTCWAEFSHLVQQAQIAVHQVVERIRSPGPMALPTIHGLPKGTIICGIISTYAEAMVSVSVVGFIASSLNFEFYHRSCGHCICIGVLYPAYDSALGTAQVLHWYYPRVYIYGLRKYCTGTAQVLRKYCSSITQALDYEPDSLLQHHRLAPRLKLVVPGKVLGDSAKTGSVLLLILQTRLGFQTKLGFRVKGSVLLY